VLIFDDFLSISEWFLKAFSMLFDAFLRVTQNELVGNEVANVRSNHNDDSKQ